MVIGIKAEGGLEIDSIPVQVGFGRILLKQISHFFSQTSTTPTTGLGHYTKVT